jgi:hypothetical protein
MHVINMEFVKPMLQSFDVATPMVFHTLHIVNIFIRVVLSLYQLICWFKIDMYNLNEGII